MTSRRSFAAGTAAMFASATSMPFGAAVGAQAFAALSPAGVVAIRNLVVAVTLVPTVRPSLRRLTWAQWWPALLLGVVLVVTNLSLATSVGRIGVALAVTLEFLGPLSVALAGSRTRLDLACGTGAGIGVYVLVLPRPTSDWLGIGLALVAAAGWASYILLNGLIGTRLPGLQGPALTSMVTTALTSPVLLWLVLSGRFHGLPLLSAVTAGILSSLLPCAADMLSLRRVPARFFGVFMSVNPVMAALAGLLVLDQRLSLHEVAGIAVIVLVNVVATVSSARVHRS